MKKEIQALWVEELRSGRREQGNGALRNGDRFCCLGVLCELAVEAGVIPPSQVNPAGTHTYGADGRYPGTEGVLPDQVVKWAGLKGPDPEFVTDGAILSLSSMNDTYKATFTQIAEYIERDEEVG